MWYNKYMGIIKYLKNLFKKTIDLADIDKSQVVALNKSNAKIKFGTRLNVPENFVCALVFKNKIADIFKEGKYKLEVTTMPVLTRIEKLTKPNKKGNLPKTFKADIYYINLNEIENQTFSNSVVYLKDKQYKIVGVRMAGVYSFKIIDPEEFMEAMFTQYGVLRNKVVKDEISYWISKLVAKRVKKNSPKVFELYARESPCFDGLIDYINDDVFDCGIKLSKIDVTDVKFPKKVYKKVTLLYEEVQEPKPTQNEGEPDVLQGCVKIEQEKEIENNSNQTYIEETVQVEVGHDNSETELHSQNSSENSYNYATRYDNAEQQDNTLLNKVLDEIQTEQNSNNIVIELDEPIQKTVEYKQCPICGAYNAKDSETCFSCKYKF